MKKRLCLGCATCAAAFLLPSTQSGLALDRIERTLLDYGLNLSEEINFEVNRQLNTRPSLNTDFYGPYPSAELFTTHEYCEKVTFFVDMNVLLFDSERTPDFEGEVYTPMFGASIETVYDINVGILYAREFLDFESINGEVTGEGDSHNFAAYLSKRLDCGFRFGGSYLYSSSTMDGSNPVGGAGDLAYNMNGASLSLGFSRTYGTNQPGRNIGFDTSVNFLYSGRSFNHQYDLSPETEFTFNNWWVSWRTEIAHNFTDRIAVYASFALNHLIDETKRSEVTASFANTVPGHDRTTGVVGGGVRARIASGLSAHLGALTSVLDDNYSNLTLGGGLSYKF